MIHSLPALRRQFLADNGSFYQLAADDPRRVKPLSMQQQKKRAKELLKRSLAGSPGVSTPVSRLADAQFAIARELGFASWSKLKRHIESAEIARQALRSAQPSALDGELRTLHIRCGNDVMYKLAVAGFNGDFLSFADPYIQGPVPALKDPEAFIRLRADFISANNWRQRDQAFAELTGDYRSLHKGREYERIAFWFEHDAYDVLVFLKMLHFFSDPAQRAPEMRFICAEGYPGVSRFNGIGQLPAEAMRVLWPQFKPLADTHFEFGRLCWQAFTASTPETLAHLMKLEDPPLPEILPALKRHLQELPWLDDGLCLSERLTLQILSEQGPQDAPSLFYHWYTTRYEPLPFMGDSSYWLLLDALARAPVPAISLSKTSQRKVDWQVALSPFGRRLLSGKAHWMARNPYDRWFGGTHNRNDRPMWYWDHAEAQVVRR